MISSLPCLQRESCLLLYLVQIRHCNLYLALLFGCKFVGGLCCCTENMLYPSFSTIDEMALDLTRNGVFLLKVQETEADVDGLSGK